MVLSIEDFLVIFASVEDVLYDIQSEAYSTLSFILDHRKLNREVEIKDKESFLSSLRSHLQRLKEIDDKEDYFKQRRGGSSAADCIGFLYQQIEILREEPSGLHRDLGTRLFTSTIGHLQELHGRREAADKDAYKRREEAAANAREDRKAYEKQNANRERYEEAAKKRREQQERGTYRSEYRYSPDWTSAFDQAKAGFTAEQINRAKSHFEEMFKTFSESADFGFDSDAFGAAGFGKTGSQNKKTPPPSPGGSQRWFEILGVSIGASKEQIQKAWRLLAKQHHPDRAGGSNEMMSKINAARDEGLGGAR